MKDYPCCVMKIRNLTRNLALILFKLFFTRTYIKNAPEKLIYVILLFNGTLCLKTYVDIGSILKDINARLDFDNKPQRQ